MPALRNPPLAGAVCTTLDHLACWRAFARAAGQPLERPGTDFAIPVRQLIKAVRPAPRMRSRHDPGYREVSITSMS